MFLTLLSLSFATLLSTTTAAPVTNPAADVQASVGKRGVPYNDGKLANLFLGGSNKVKWAYNWDSSRGDLDKSIEYVPMLHDTLTVNTAKFRENVKKSGATHIMSFNEPDQCGKDTGGVCMQDVAATVKAHMNYVQPIAKDFPNIQIGAPAVTNGEWDNNTQKPMGLPYLKQFLDGCKTAGCRIDFISIHWYDSADNIIYFKKHVEEAHRMSNKPVWITEFTPSGSVAQIQNFLKEVLPWLEHPNQSYVQRYAYQWAARGSLVDGTGKKLTPVGQTYASV
ncbi:hypothetical protein GQ43DRAFT_379378 [Delitschia confertaspora ATCC 74209]|uniref:Asl1-like glycosyl hydrolase catalytic domain-containing protein n=1 Tax=Delitschia confertaspora ATCC 74209 TaxID=1513339 RepID=A0A9P4JKF2_9PLEO|nr:hypothetical protein GQ43DRAFT_379378 [Delitschia confertaspora ATCC 74209]